MDRNRLMFGLAMLGLGACTPLLPSAGSLSPRLALDPNAFVTTEFRPIETSLVVSDPSAEAVYNTANVAVATAPFQYEYLKNAQWTDRVPVMFRVFMERRFESIGAFTAVGDRTDLPLAAYDLKTDIRAFHLDRSGDEAIARVAFGARLVDRRGRTLGSRVFRASEPVDGSDRVTTVEALNLAATRAVDEAVVWARDLVATAERKSGAGEMSGG